MSTQKICGRNLGECEKLLSKQTIKECFPCSSKIPCEKFIKFLTSILSNHQMVLTLVQMQLFTMCNVVATLKFFSLVFGDFLVSDSFYGKPTYQVPISCLQCLTTFD